MGNLAQSLVRAPRLAGPRPASPKASDPSAVGPFEIVMRLGGGTMASVHLARHRVLPEIVVALRTPHRHLGADPDFAAVYLDEARILSALRHPNAVSLFEGACDAASLYTAMEYVQGDTFATVQRVASALGRNIPEGIVVRVVADVLEGLHATHELRTAEGLPMAVVHRDVTPQNVLIGVDGVARISGFASARAEGRVAFTAPGILKGKLAFMAPEVLLALRFDRRADVFSAGVMLWEAFALQRLFPDRTDYLTARQLARVPARSLSAVRPDLSPRLCDAVARALAIDPAERHVTAAEFARVLRDEAGVQPATDDELGAFVESVARAKIERERRALRASRPVHEVIPVLDEELHLALPDLLHAMTEERDGDSGVRAMRPSPLRGPTLPSYGFRAILAPQVSPDAVAPEGWRPEDLMAVDVPTANDDGRRSYPPAAEAVVTPPSPIAGVEPEPDAPSDARAAEDTDEPAAMVIEVDDEDPFGVVPARSSWTPLASPPAQGPDGAVVARTAAWVVVAVATAAACVSAVSVLVLALHG